MRHFFSIQAGRASRRFWLLALGLLGAGLPSVAGAQSDEATFRPRTLSDPAALIRPQADVVLRRDESPDTLTVVVPRSLGAQTLANRYGVSLAAVRLLPGSAPAAVASIELHRSVLDRAPLRPVSIRPYRVRAGDTLAGIAARSGLRVVDLLGVNLDRPSLDLIQVGSLLNIPTGPRGVLLRIKPGQSALSLIAGYRADPVATARANGVLPTEMRVGDELLLPGIQAEAFEQQLLARREAERRAQIAYRQQQQYEQFLSWKQLQTRRRLEAQYRQQEQYERYLAWKDSAERRAQVEAYERQVRFEAAQAAAREAAQQAARAAERARQAAPATATAGAAGGVRRASTGGTGLAWPMRSFRLTSRFGERDISFHRQIFHGGIDLAAPYGSPIYAASAGQVTRSGYGDYGLNVYVENGNSTVIYGHMSRVAAYSGQSVVQGQLLGYVGCSGICTGPHLHFEVRIGGQAVNPLALLP